MPVPADPIDRLPVKPTIGDRRETCFGRKRIVADYETSALAADPVGHGVGTTGGRRVFGFDGAGRHNPPKSRHLS